jgi:hypothetical protein
MSEWLERELAKSLEPKRAPHALWARIMSAPRSEPVRRFSAQLAFWPMAALVLFGSAAAWTLVDRHTPMDFERAALSNLQTASLSANADRGGALRIAEGHLSRVRLSDRADCRTCHLTNVL